MAEYHRPQDFIIFYVVVSVLFAVIGYLRLLARTYTTVWRKEPPYWKSTLYVITDHRAMMIVRIPGGTLKVFEYLPTEIDPPATLVRPDGSGIVTFGASREYKIGRYGLPITLPGSFLGISRVQVVVDLLQALRSGGEQAQCSSEQLST